MSSDLDKLRATIAAMPYAQALGFDVCGDGEDLLGRMPFADRLVGNPAVPSLHGGVLGGFLQLAATSRLMLHLQLERAPTLFSITAQYLRPARKLDSFARATITSCGRRFASVRVVAYQDEESQPFATANIQFLLVE